MRRRSSSLSPSAPSFSSKDSLNSSIRSACLHSNRSHWKIELANAELENFQMDPQKINEIKMLRRASRASNTEHLKRQYSHNQSLTSDELQKTSTRELLGDSHSKLGFAHITGSRALTQCLEMLCFHKKNQVKRSHQRKAFTRIENEKKVFAFPTNSVLQHILQQKV